jgi:hypothetical protein
MKTRKFIALALLLVAFIMSVLSASSQVTIGQNEAPEKYATLQIKDKVIDRTGDLSTATAEKGGLLLPRVELKKKKELLPFVDQTEVETDPQPEEYKKAKLLHTGLVVYNLVESDDEDLCIGINQWDGEQWNCLQNKMGNAVAELGGCDSLTFVGLYQNEVPLNAGNYMTIPLHVTRAGAYTITAVPDPDNGYYFTTTGVFMTAGYYFISIPGAGTPLNHTEGGPNDNIIVKLNNKVINASCPKSIPVKDSSKKPLYSMSCNGIKVNGLYMVNKPLDGSTNYIDITLNVDALAFGAVYVIETNTVDGIHFKGEGVLSNNTSQSVRLIGYGTPTSVNSKKLTITSNSTKSVATCEVTVTITIPKKKVLALGHAAGLYNVASAISGGNILMTNPLAFGTLTNSVVSSQGFEFTTIVSGTMMDNTTLKNALDAKPDIVIMGYDTYITTANAALLADYLNKKGVILAYNEGGGSNPGSGGAAGELMRAVFNNNTISQGAPTLINSAGAVYGFSSIEDEVLNGPFGNIKGLQWGEDSSQTAGLINLPEDQITVYSTGYDMSNNIDTYVNRITAFRHKTLSLIWVGDGGFFAYSATDPVRSGYPFKLDGNKLPISKSNYGSADARPRYSVYNSIFFANALSWAIKQAEFDGINTIR